MGSTTDKVSGVANRIFIPIAIAIPVSFVLSPPGSRAAALGFGSCRIRLDRRPCGAGRRISGQRRFDAAGFRTGC
jgi:hypothetical protein